MCCSGLVSIRRRRYISSRHGCGSRCLPRILCAPIYTAWASEAITRLVTGYVHAASLVAAVVLMLRRPRAASRATSDSLPWRSITTTVATSARPAREAARGDRAEPGAEHPPRWRRSCSRAWCASPSELGAPIEAGVRSRHRTLFKLRWQPKDHRRHRGSAGDRENGPSPATPRAPGPANSRPASASRATSRSIPGGVILQTTPVCDRVGDLARPAFRQTPKARPNQLLTNTGTCSRVRQTGSFSPKARVMNDD